jgi:hypothetical protein
MRPILTALLLTATPAFAESDVSALIAANGLRAAEAQLAAIAEPSPSDRFALGGVRFLAAVETALQTRWKVGLTEGLTTLVDLPVLRLPIPENPTPARFEGAVIAEMFAAVQGDLDSAAAQLDMISDADAVGVTINTTDIWFDIDRNGTRTAGEGLAEVLGTALQAPLADATIRFDTADAAWLSAYAHLLGGLSDLIVAFDPGPAIDDVLAARAAFDALNAQVNQPFGTGIDMMGGDYIDLAAMIVDALERQPDPDLTQSALNHWLAMVDRNRVFWVRVAAETDNDAEWIPNKGQVSALGLPFPADTGQRWLNVLAEAEAVLTGNALIPHWRLADGAGVDLYALMTNPPEIDVLGMAHGMDLLPYIRTGRVISWDSWRQFADLTEGNAGMYAVILN